MPITGRCQIDFGFLSLECPVLCHHALLGYLGLLSMCSVLCKGTWYDVS